LITLMKMQSKVLVNQSETVIGKNTIYNTSLKTMLNN